MLKLTCRLYGIFAGPVLAGLLLVACTFQPPPANTPTPAEPTLNATTLKPAWTFDAGGPINASPLRVGEVVITAAVGGPLIAVEVASGQVRWQYSPPAAVWERSYAANNQTVFVGVEGGQLVALEAQTGKVRWQKQLGINVQIAPQVVEDVLYVPTTFVGPGLAANPAGRAKIFALSAATGQELWSFETGNYILQTPFVYGDTLYAGGSYHNPALEVDEGGPMRLYALSTTDGSLRWVYESEDGFVKALYATGDTVAYIAYQDFAVGVNARTGAPLWRRDTGNWVPSLAGNGDTLYFGSANTVVHALNMASGKTVWQYNIGGGSFNYMLGAPVSLAGDLYFLTQQGDIIALEAATGRFKWQIPTGITGARDGLSVSGGWLFIGDGTGRLYAYTGQKL